jgi:toxin-antitoxin system PIN domain toxin
MLLLDVNVVVAAYREDLPQHELVSCWLDDLADQRETFTVPSTVWASFLRLVTNRRIFDPPVTVQDAFAFVDAVCARPNHLLVAPGPRHLELLRRVCEEADATGDLVSDAVLAAIALEHDCVVASLDRDFARFPSIEFVVPGAR